MVKIKQKAIKLIKIISPLLFIYLALIISELFLKIKGNNISAIYRIITNEFQLIKNPINIYKDTSNINSLLKTHVLLSVIIIVIYLRNKIKLIKNIRKKLLLEDETKRKIITNTLYFILIVIVVYASLLISEVWLKMRGNPFPEMYMIFTREFEIIKNPLEIYQANLEIKDLVIGQAIISALALALLYYSIDKKGEFDLKEKGSAEWGDDKYRFKNSLDKKEGNIILSKTEFLPVDMREIYRNRNILIIGGSGTGKTRYFVKPNLMQLNTSFIITDPKGEIYRDTAYMFKKNGYEVKILNLKEPKYSDGYNPFNYIINERHIEVLAETMMKNTASKEKTGGDPFWEDSSKALLTALLYYTYRIEDEEERNLQTVFDLILKGKMEDEGEITELDLIMENIELDNPARKYYSIFSLAPMKTRNSILISLGTQLAFLGSPEIRNIVLKDTLNLRNHETKRTLFVITPDSSGAYDMLAAIFYTHLFQILYEEADKQENLMLKTPHQFILDEFANIGEIPHFEKLITTMRSRDISAVPILQNEAQLENIYRKNSRTIIGNCDTILYLGGSDKQAAKEISERLGKTTITVTDTSMQKNEGQSNSYTKNTRKDYRELMTLDEVLTMPDENMIVSIRGYKPFKSEKYDITKHENYNLIKNKKTFYNREYKLNSNILKYNKLINEEENIEIDLMELSKKTEELIKKTDKLVKKSG